MPMNISLALAGAQAAALIAALNGGTMVTYSGPRPATPETTATGTALATNNLNATFGTQTNGVVTANAITSATASATGIPGYFRLLNSSSAAQIDLVVAPAWGASLAYPAGQIVTNGGNYYLVTTAGTSASSGGPTTTAASITDNTVTWKYLGPVTAGAWAASTAYVVNQVVTNGGNSYKCVAAGTSASSGGPSGTGSATITDGTATWVYVSSAGAAAGVDATTPTTQVTAGSTWSISSLTINENGL